MNQGNVPNQTATQQVPQPAVQQVTSQVVQQTVPAAMSPEELQKTQVLNLQDVEATAKFEKSISKKPAIIVGILGVLLLVFGITFQVTNSLTSNKTTETANNKTPEIEVEDEPEVLADEVKEERLQCTHSEADSGDGTGYVYTIDFIFNEGLLTGFTKVYVINALEGNPQGIDTVKNYALNYEAFKNPTTGYAIDIVPKEDNTQLMVTVQVDLTTLDVSTLNPTQANHMSTEVNFQKDMTKDTIETQLTSLQFTCTGE